MSRVQRLKWRAGAAASAIILFLHTPAQGQYIGPWDFNIPMNSAQNMSTEIGNSIIEDARENSPKDDDQIASKLGILTYQVSKERRKTNQYRILSDMAVDQDTTHTDFIEQVDPMLKPLGLNSNNVADAFTFWWLIAWHAANKKPFVPNSSVAASVNKQAMMAFIKMPHIVAATDSDKQEMAETFLLRAIMTEALVQGARGTPERLDQYALAVNQSAKQMGIDLTSLKLTENGFAER